MDRRARASSNSRTNVTEPDDQRRAGPHHLHWAHLAPDFKEVIAEAFELVEKRFITEEDFKEFTFTNAARLHTRNNPNFFKGTVVGRAVAQELGLKTAALAKA